MEEDFKSGNIPGKGDFRLSRGKLRTGAVLRPDQPGAKKLARKYGKSLLCVRYRYDKECGVRLVTVELVEEALPWSPRPRKKSPDKVFVYIKVEKDEVELRAIVKAARGFWDPDKKLWRLKRVKVVDLDLVDRIVPEERKNRK